MNFPAPYDCHWLLLFSLILIGFRKIWTQIQLADEKSTIKALRKRQEKDREEMEKLNTDLNVSVWQSLFVNFIFFLTGANVLKLATRVGLWRMIEGKELRILHTCLIYMLTFHLTGRQDLFGSLPLFTEHGSSLQGREQFRKKLWCCVGGRLINKNRVYQ